jgi:MshEN domain
MKPPARPGSALGAGLLTPPHRAADPRLWKRRRLAKAMGVDVRELFMNWWDNIPYIDLTDMTIAPSVIDLVPESVARENTVLPLAFEDGAIKLVTADPTDLDTLQKLQFILNKELRPVLSSREQIVEAINRHYGQ